jgi:hypothetical protein
VIPLSLPVLVRGGTKGPAASSSSGPPALALSLPLLLLVLVGDIDLGRPLGRPLPLPRELLRLGDGGAVARAMVFHLDHVPVTNGEQEFTLVADRLQGGAQFVAHLERRLLEASLEEFDQMVTRRSVIQAVLQKPDHLPQIAVHRPHGIDVSPQQVEELRRPLNMLERRVLEAEAQAGDAGITTNQTEDRTRAEEVEHFRPFLETHERDPGRLVHEADLDPFGRRPPLIAVDMRRLHGDAGLDEGVEREVFPLVGEDEEGIGLLGFDPVEAAGENCPEGHVRAVVLHGLDRMAPDLEGGIDPEPGREFDAGIDGGLAQVDGREIHVREPSAAARRFGRSFYQIK